MTLPRTGIVFNRDDSDEIRPVVSTDMSVIWLEGTSADADVSYYPLNTPTLINSSDQTALTALGTGSLAIAVALINSQLSPLQIAARIVVQRVAVGASDDETIANIVGSQAAGSGLYGALGVGQRLGVVPRLFGFSDGLTGAFARQSSGTSVTRAAKSGGNTGAGSMTLAVTPYLSGVMAGVYQVRCIGGALGATAAPKSGGNLGNGALTLAGTPIGNGATAGIYRATCYAAATNSGIFVVEDPNGVTLGVATVGAPFVGQVNFTIADGSTDFVAGDQFLITAAPSVSANGGLFSVTRPDGSSLPTASVGVAYAHEIAFTIADGNPDFVLGDGFDVTVSMSSGEALANPICAALPQVLNALLSHAVVGGPGLTRQDAQDWRETIACDHIIATDCWVIVQSGSTTTIVDGSPIALGLAVACDYQAKGGQGVPSQSWAYQAVQGILGLKRYDSFSLADGATDGQELLSSNVGIIERGEAGVETAAASSGFVFIGFDNAGTDELWRFYNVTRTRDYIDLQLMKAWRQRLGRNNITRHAIQAVENDMVSLLGGLKTDEHIIDFRVGFEASKNSPDDIRAGKIRVYFKAEEASPLIFIECDSRRYRDALTALVTDMAGETSTLLTSSS